MPGQEGEGRCRIMKEILKGGLFRESPFVVGQYFINSEKWMFFKLINTKQNTKYGHQFFFFRYLISLCHYEAQNLILIGTTTSLHSW